MTRREYAERRGCTVQAVGKAIRQGRIEVTADGLIDPEVADILWRRRTDPAQSARASARSAGPAQDGLDASRARREAAMAELAELELARQRGDLVRVADVERQLAARIIGLREALLAIPDRIGPAATGLTAAEVSRELRKELEHALSMFHESLNQEVENDDG